MFQLIPLRHRRWFVSLAILAVLMNALAPGLSQAIQAGGSSRTASWLEVCSATGSKWIKLDAASQVLEQSAKRPAEAPASAHDEACGYCLSHAASFALLELAQPWARPTLQPVSAGVRPQAQRPSAAAPSWTRPALRAPPQA